MTQQERIKAIVQEAYSLTPINVELIKDADNLVYQLLTYDDRKYSVKIQRRRFKQADEKIATLCDWLEFASDRIKFDLPVPIRNHQGNFLSSIQLQESQHTVTIYNWVEGNPVSTRMTDENIAKIGSLMASLHNVSENYEGKGKGLRSYDGVWLQQARETLLSGAERVGFSSKNRENLLSGLRNIESNMDELGYTPQHFGIIHSDLHFRNMLLSGESLSVIDFDDAGFGHYLFDIGTTFNEFEDYGERYTSMVESFIQGYQSQRTIPQDWEKRVQYFKGVAAVAYAEWVFLPENEWATNKKIQFGISSLEQICELQ
jgi:Ser/Thr protein kinase RdoA (MazF antagonist)